MAILGKLFGKRNSSEDDGTLMMFFALRLGAIFGDEVYKINGHQVINYELVTCFDFVQMITVVRLFPNKNVKEEKVRGIWEAILKTHLKEQYKGFSERIADLSNRLLSLIDFKSSRDNALAALGEIGFSLKKEIYGVNGEKIDNNTYRRTISDEVLDKVSLLNTLGKDIPDEEIMLYFVRPSNEYQKEIVSMIVSEINDIKFGIQN